MHANNEIGTIEPIKQIAAIIKEKRATRLTNGLPLYLHTDAAQAANYLDLHVSRLGIDLMTLNGSKAYGPKQSGCLYLASRVKINPLIEGGGQERNLRSGTENVSGAVGLAEALALAQKLRSAEQKRLSNLQKQFINELVKAIPEVVINGSIKHRLPNNVHITIPSADNETILFRLDEKGIMAAAGSACSASSEEASHVLNAIGQSDVAARASLRFTMGRQTMPTDIKYAVKQLSQIVKNI
jgi:cysteine desulfurase